MNNAQCHRNKCPIRGIKSHRNLYVITFACMLAGRTFIYVHTADTNSTQRTITSTIGQQQHTYFFVCRWCACTYWLNNLMLACIVRNMQCSPSHILYTRTRTNQLRYINWTIIRNGVSECTDLLQIAGQIVASGLWTEYIYNVCSHVACTIDGI